MPIELQPEDRDFRRGETRVILRGNLGYRVGLFGGEEHLHSPMDLSSETRYADGLDVPVAGPWEHLIFSGFTEVL